MGATEAVSRRLSYVLRHNPASVGLSVDDAGWVGVPALLDALTRDGLALSRPDLERVVAENDKQRFQLDGDRIRARQGHSIAVDLGLAPATPPAVLFHGTPAANVDSIRQRGLVRGSRHHVHLSGDRTTAVRAGARRGQPVVFEVDARSMAADGHVFFVTGNGVWLTEAVPARYLTLP